MDEYMSPAVGVTPPVAFILTICVCFICGLDRQLDLQGIDLPLKLADHFLHHSYHRILGCHVLGMICHLCRYVHFGVSEVSY